jgi:hypothetical protein
MSIANASNPDEPSRSALGTIWPLPAVPVMLAFLTAIALVWAEDRQYWLMAQASVVIILLLLSLSAWLWWEKKNKHQHYSATAHVYHRAIQKLLLCVAIGITALVLNGIRIDRWRTGFVAQALGYGILFAGAAFISGVMLGYLFGLRPSGETKNAASQASASPAQSNLEEIADWLTKLILGAGLVALTKLPGPILKFAIFMAGGVDPMPPAPVPQGVQGNPAIALAIMGFFSTCGLLYGYLWTRYEHAVTSDSDADTSALATVARWLRAADTPDDQARTDMVNAIKKASLEAKMQILQQAQQYRTPSSPKVNDRVAVVLQTLVDADSRGLFHRNRGEYAMALMGKTKDPKNPDDSWNRAHDLLNDAIKIRDRSGETGWHQYELARAVCQIHLDVNFNRGQPSSPEGWQSIAADLDSAKDVPKPESDLIDEAHVIADWKRQNPIT